MAQNVTVAGASYSAVPSVDLPTTGGGTSSFYDVSGTTATASDVASGKVFYDALGVLTTGTASGGGGANVPTFTAIWDDSIGDYRSITCDWTYAECRASSESDPTMTAALYVETDTEQSFSGTMGMSCQPTGSTLKYYVGAGLAWFQINYTASGISWSASPDVYQSLTATQNGTYTPTSGKAYNSVVVNVPSGGSSMNAQSAQSTTRSTSTSYTEVISLTCDTAGTYDVYWTTFRSSTSGTWGSQLYLGSTAYGSAQTGSWSNHVQNIHLTGVSISANQEVSVHVRSRGSNYYGYVGTLTIIQTA